jgi:hypothetical protein
MERQGCKKLKRLGGDLKVSVRMDSQEQGIAGAAVISGDFRCGGVCFEKFVYGSEEGWSEGFGYCCRWF